MRNVTIVLLMVAVVGVWATGADAAITEIKDSANFNIKEFEGDSVPTAVYGTMDWTVDGGNYVIVQDGDDGMAGKSDEFAYATGWTVETRFKVTVNPTDHVYQLIVGDSSQEYGLWISDSQIYDYGSGNAYLCDFTDDFHTLRVAQEGNGGETKVYVDDVDTGLAVASTGGSNNWQWFGDGTGHIYDGTVLVDYFRMDSTGGYAPIPEPATMVLLGLGGIGVLIRRKRR